MNAPLLQVGHSMNGILRLVRWAGTGAVVLVSGVLFVACGSNVSQIQNGECFVIDDVGITPDGSKISQIRTVECPKEGVTPTGSNISQIQSGDCFIIVDVGYDIRGSKLSQIRAVECPKEAPAADEGVENDAAILDDSAEDDTGGVQAEVPAEAAAADLAAKLDEAARDVTAKARAEAGLEEATPEDDLGN